MSLHIPLAPSPRFERAYPSPDAAATIHDGQDLNRAMEAYRFFYPSVSVEAMFQGLRDNGFSDGKQLIVLAAGPRHVGFTVNSDTPYATGMLDLASMGPVVVELPPGPYIGLFNDHHQRWIADMGIPGPDGGRGGKYVIIPPGSIATVPHGYHVGHAESFQVLLALRALPIQGNVAGAIEALRRVKVYALAKPAQILSFIDVSQQALDLSPLRWEDNLEFWNRLASIIEHEPIIEEFRPMYGELAALGMERGMPFAPTPRMAQILELAARKALEQMRVEAFASERPDRIVWNDRQWEWVGLVPDDADFETRTFLDLEARDRWFFQAIVASPAMFRRSVGAGSIYFLAARDAAGKYLDGGRTYKLSVPQPVPAQLFWSVTAYDARTRSQLQTPQDRAVLGSLRDKFAVSSDGNVDIFFGPEPPPGKERQWIQTLPGTGYFLYFRIYGPGTAALDGAWVLGDVAPIDSRGAKAPRDSELLAISTAEVVPTRGGELRFQHGVPTPETAARVYEQLDVLHGIEAFLNGLPAVSMQALHRGLIDAGVQDHDVLIFSGLMDSKSLFLTANCDTVYFFTFLDLSDGPVVVDIPRGVLGVLDDMWWRWVTDLGMAGPDRGEGGRYLLIPEGYQGPLPEGGYYMAKVRTSRAFLLARAFLEHDDPAPAVRRIRAGLKIYRYAPGGAGSSVAGFLDGRSPFHPLEPAEPPRFVEGTGLSIHTIPPNDRSYFELLDQAVQQEPADVLEPEIAGQLAGLGIVKGHPFRPDAERLKILDEAVAFANAAARTVSFRPRDSEAFAYYGRGSAWTNMLFASGFDFMRPPPEITKHGVAPFPSTGARALHARTAMFYLATGITPAMCMRMVGIGSQYIAAMLDSNGQPLQGARAYALTLPPNIPAAAFWSVTLYDNQTRSMLQTSQRFPRAGSQAYPTPEARTNADGAITLAFAPKRPEGFEDGNWIETVPGKNWFAILRLYSPLAPFFDKSWRPGEIEPLLPA